MQCKKFVAVVALALTIWVGSALYEFAAAQKTQGATRPAATKYLMRGIMQPNCGGLGASLKDAGPADDKAWELAAQQAACLNEMSYLLMDDHRCPDAVWLDAASVTLRKGSADAMDAIEKKDVAAAQAAFQSLLKSCAACHTAHKGK